MSDTVRDRRPGCQFSLRTLLLFVLVTGIRSGWIGSWMKWKREQREAINRLRAYGTPPVMSRITDTTVFRANESVTDSDLEEIQRLLRYVPNIECVSLEGTAVKGPELGHLASLPKLTRLELKGTPIGDAGLMHLREVPNVTYVGLAGTLVTDAGLDVLQELTQLETLDLCNTEVTEARVRELQETLPGCRVYRKGFGDRR